MPDTTRCTMPTQVYVILNHVTGNHCMGRDNDKLHDAYRWDVDSDGCESETRPRSELAISRVTWH